MSNSNGEIGAFYQFLGAIALFGGILAVLLKAHVYVVIVLCIVCLALVRPVWLDEMVKLLADKVPFFKYTKPPV